MKDPLGEELRLKKHDRQCAEHEKEIAKMTTKELIKKYGIGIIPDWVKDETIQGICGETIPFYEPMCQTCTEDLDPDMEREQRKLGDI